MEVPEYPAFDGTTAADKPESGDVERRGWRAEDHKCAFGGEAALGRAHRRAVGDGGENDFSTAEFGEFGGGILRLAVNVMHRAKLAGERLLILAARDGDGLEAHFGGVLRAEMAETAEAEDGDEIAGARAAVAQGVEGGDAGAHERRGIGGREVIGHERDADGGGDHVIRVAAIEVDAGDLVVHGAGEEIAAAAIIAMATMLSMPADADALAGFPFRNACANGVNDADDFMARDAGILDAGKQAGLGDGIAVANAAGLDFDADGAGTGLGNVAFDNF